MGGEKKTSIDTDLCNQFNEIISMPARQVCQNFFRDVLAPFHKLRKDRRWF